MVGTFRAWIDGEASEFARLLEGALCDAESVLDVGCGSASPVRLLGRRPPRMVGVDGYAPALETSQRAGIHDEYQCFPIGEIGRRFANGSFDAVVLLDVLEHLEKPAGVALLGAVEGIARRKVVVFTPNGFLPQGELDANPFQVHRSGWTAHELRQRGYSVVGVNGLRPLRGHLAQIRFRPRRFWWAVSLASQPLVRARPEYAFQLFAVRSSDAG